MSSSVFVRLGKEKAIDPEAQPCESFRQALQEFFKHTVEFLWVIDK